MSQRKFPSPETAEPFLAPRKGTLCVRQGHGAGQGHRGVLSVFSRQAQQSCGLVQHAIPKARKAALGMKSECIISTSSQLPRRFKLFIFAFRRPARPGMLSLGQDLGGCGAARVPCPVPSSSQACGTSAQCFCRDNWYFQRL